MSDIKSGPPASASAPVPEHTTQMPLTASKSHLRSMVEAAKRSWRGDCNMTEGLMDVGILTGVLLLKAWLFQITWNQTMPYVTRKDMKFFRKINYSTALGFVLMFEILIM